MSNIIIYTITGESVGEMTLRDDIFSIRPNNAVVHEKLVAQLANRRQGNASTKTRAFVSGGGAKPWKQKGTGRARVGSNRSPLWVGGAVVFGPQPRSYRQSVNKKKTRLAIKSVLAARFQEGAFIVIDNLAFSEIKTKQITQMLKNLKITGSVLFLVKNAEDTLRKSMRNITDTKLTMVQNLNVFDLLKYNQIIFTKEALEEIQQKFAQLE